MPHRAAHLAFHQCDPGGRDIVISRYDIDARESYKARSVYTQLTIIVKVILVLVVVIALAAMLMIFTKIRAFGVSILASAGIMGIIFGFAAQRSLSTLLAGLPIAITQPIRINDIVIVEGEWGTIEEITLTYVVVKIWDLRRLIVPVTFFLEKTFQSWTRSTSNILGTVFIKVDYSAPVQEIRLKLRGILERSELWDREDCGLQVTEAGEQVMDLRATMSDAFLACLDGSADIAFTLEAEAEHGVSDIGQTPVDQNEVDTLQSVQVEGLVIVAHGVVSLAAVIAVSYVVDGDPFAIDFRPGKHCHVRLPVPVVGRLLQQPQHLPKLRQPSNTFM